MVVQEASINNIMGGLEGAEGVKLHTHRRKLKQRFDIIKKLGQGTYGKVQLGVNKETGQEVAIKTIKKCKIETEADLTRIRREIQIMSSLRHPFIIHIYEVFENKDKIVLVMEYAAGGELYDYLSQRKVLDEKEARRLFRQIAMAVYYCHKHQICHRDLKLENILLDCEGNAKIADFGLSNVFDSNRLLSTFCGSPLYASPEIVKGIPYYGPEVDCWSMGVLLYTLVYGAMPFDGSNFKRLVRQISNGEYYEPKTPSGASGLIRRLLTVDGSERVDIVGVCSDPWLNTDEQTSCVRQALDLSTEKPVRLDLLLCLAPQPNQDAVNAKEGTGVVRSHSVGSVAAPGSSEVQRRPRQKDSEEEKQSRRREKSRSRSARKAAASASPAPPAESTNSEASPPSQPHTDIDMAEVLEQAKVISDRLTSDGAMTGIEGGGTFVLPSVDAKAPEVTLKETEEAQPVSETPLPESTVTPAQPEPAPAQPEPQPTPSLSPPPSPSHEAAPQETAPQPAPRSLPAKDSEGSSLVGENTPADFLASTVHLDQLVRSEIGEPPQTPADRDKKDQAIKVISNAISESALSDGDRKAFTLPRRKLSLGKPPSPVVRPDMVARTTSVSQVVYPRAPLVKQGSAPAAPREHIIPIKVEEREPSLPPQPSVSQSASQPATKPPQISKQASLASSTTSTHSLGRQDSDSWSVSSGGEPIRKSPREVIIPIAVEGGGFITPSQHALDRLQKADSREEDDVSSSRGGFGLHSTRRRQPHLETTDSISSDEDDDNFEILTAENLFSTLLSRVRSLTQRLNEDQRPSSLSSRLFNHHSVFDSPLHPSRSTVVTHSSGEGGRSTGEGLPWRRQSSLSQSSSTLPRARVTVHVPLVEKD